MSGFPWTSLLTAVVPAAAVLAGAALTGRQNNQAGQTAALKADYAAFVQGVTALIERLDDPREADDPRGPGVPRLDPRADVQQLVSAIASARALVDLAGSFGARKTASDVWQAALRATDASEHRNSLTQNPAAPSQFREQVRKQAAVQALAELRAALEQGFLRAVRAEVGGESRPGLKWIIKDVLWRRRRRRYEHR
jgi:hypothetical protein